MRAAAARAGAAPRSPTRFKISNARPRQLYVVGGGPSAAPSLYEDPDALYLDDDGHPLFMVSGSGAPEADGGVALETLQVGWGRGVFHAALFPTQRSARRTLIDASFAVKRRRLVVGLTPTTHNLV